MSIGAAISVMRLPAPAQVLGSSAIGLQTLTKTRLRYDNWIGSNSAVFLFAKVRRCFAVLSPQKLTLEKGCGTPCSVVDHTSKKSNSKRNRKRKFALVCDPAYMSNRGKRTANTAFPPIPIGLPHEVLSGPLSTYDLGWDVLAAELPPGNIKFSIHGQDIDRLCGNSDCPEVARQDQITIWLSCRKMDKGREMLDHPSNKTWKLLLQTDPASKLLVIDSAELV